MRRHNKPTYGVEKLFENGSEIKFEDDLDENDITSFGLQEPTIQKDTSGATSDDKAGRESKLGKRTSARLSRKKLDDSVKATSESGAS